MNQKEKSNSHIPKNTVKIAPGVHWVGVKDWNRKMFDRLIPLPKGTSYNAYLIQGRKKTALVDTVNPGFEQDLEAKIRTIMDPGDIDYIIMNHAEPDHSNAITHILPLTQNGRVLTTKKGKEMVQSMYSIPDSKMETVTHKSTLDLGGKTLQFLSTPWLHWPETMVTFYEEEEILFPCDFLGSHLATSKFYADELGDRVIDYAKSYYGEIMMPFRPMVQKALKKLEELDIEIIAPSHGPIYRHPETILEEYRKWGRGDVKEKVLVVYISMWGNTEKMAKIVADTIASEKVEVEPFHLPTRGLDELAKELVDSAGVIIGTPTVLGGAHPNMFYATYLAKKLNPPTKYLGVLESHGWAGGAVQQLIDIVDDMDAEIVGSVESLGSPSEKTIEELIKFGRKFARKVAEKK